MSSDEQSYRFQVLGAGARRPVMANTWHLKPET